ncbi:MAG TPA: Ig-like domain-containing protein, partial [Thermoanaerobaculia bacterium]|nr:Ig-like domain-containing protein [Thermoanaerobaculia bacterium]
MRRFAALLAGLALAAGAVYLLAQTAAVSEDFQGFAVGSTPAGWIDDLVGSLTARPHGFFQVAADPADPANRVLASAGDSGMERGAAITRTGFLAHRLDPVFDVTRGALSVTGRMLRQSAQGAAGVVILSGYPLDDAYYVLGCWPSETGGPDHFWLAANGPSLAGSPVDLGVSASAGLWYRFRIDVETGGGGTRIRARFWPDGSAEPGDYNMDIVDTSAGRRTSGRIGFWASRRGFKAFDDLSASGGIASPPGPTPSPTPSVSQTPPPTATPGGPSRTPTAPGPTPTPPPGGALIVRLTESGHPLADGALFNRDVRPDWTIEGGAPPYSATATLSGKPFSEGNSVSAEGSYRLAVQVSDSRGAAAQAAASFTIDKTPPAFSNLRPLSSTILGSRVVAFSGNVSSDAVAVTVAGRTAVLSGGFFSLPDLALSEGGNTVALSAVDRAGNVGALGYPLTVDTTPPALTITSPADHAVTKDPAATVSGSVADASAVTVSVNGIAAAVSGSTFTATGVPLTEGSNPIQASARDAAGNASQAGITVDRDTKPPAISILDGSHELHDGDLLNHHPAPVIAIADAHLAGSAVLLNGAPFVSGTPIPADGAFTFDVDAHDAAGNSAHQTVHFSVDTVAPHITNISPADGSLVTSSPQAVTGDCEDAVTVTVNGVAATVSSGHFRVDSFAFPDGSVTLSFAAKDRAGNTGSASVNVTVDTVPPVVSIDSPANGAYLKTATATVT